MSTKAEVIEKLKRNTQSRWSASMVFFDRTLDSAIEDSRVEAVEIFDAAVCLGILARKADWTFCSDLESRGFSRVEFGDCCLARINQDRFRPSAFDPTSYLFFLFDAMEVVLSQAETDLSRLFKLIDITNGITFIGPLGGGKSFFLQFLVRKLRALGGHRVIYIANPELLFISARNHFYLIVLEISFALASDLSRADSKDLRALLLENLQLLRDQSTGISESINALNTCLSACKRYCEDILNVRLVMAVDQENSFVSECDPSESSEKKRALLDCLAGDASNFHYLLTTTSATSEAFKSKIPRTYMHLIQGLSDDDIARMVNVAFQHRAPRGIDSRPGLTCRYLVTHVGRWYWEIARVILAYINDPNCKTLVSRAHKYYVNGDTKISEFSQKHKLWFNRQLPEVQKPFLILLSIADCCPTIQAPGYIIANESSSPYVVRPVAFSGWSKRSDEELELFSTCAQRSDNRLSDNEDFMYLYDKFKLRRLTEFLGGHQRTDSTEETNTNITLNCFADDSEYGKLADPAEAMNCLDQRFFYIDADLHVRCTSFKILQEIRRLHTSRYTDDRFAKSMKANLVKDPTIQGKIFEYTTISSLQTIDTPYEIRMNAIYGTIADARSVTIAVDRAKNLAPSESLTSIPHAVRSFCNPYYNRASLMVPNYPNFSDIDLFVITELKGIESQVPDFCPLIIPGTKYAHEYDSVKKGDSVCDLVLVKITANVYKHGKGDDRLVETFEESYKIGVDETLKTVRNLKLYSIFRLP